MHRFTRAQVRFRAAGRQAPHWSSSVPSNGCDTPSSCDTARDMCDVRVIVILVCGGAGLSVSPEVGFLAACDTLPAITQYGW